MFISCTYSTEWAAIAQTKTADTKDGDKHADAKRWFVEGIIKIWIKIGYKKPTITWSGSYGSPKATGALMNFVNAAGRPLGFTAMESAVREGIALWKNEQKMPHKSPLSS